MIIFFFLFGLAIGSFLNCVIYRLEKKEGAIIPEQVAGKKIILVAGSEGRGIRMEIAGTPVVVPHHPDLESSAMRHK